jgi:arginyl-tRNA synthetase
VLPLNKIELALQTAVREILPDADVSTILVRPCDPKFGDYQSNALMSLAKIYKRNPRQLAEEVLVKLNVEHVCEKPEIAGAGFLNFRLKKAVLAQTLESAMRDEHLFFTKTAKPKTIIIDFSSPNVAKPMHVGHIRSTGIGDALQRMLRLLGHKVVSDNHIGDWGTQFGKLLLGWKQILDREALNRDAIAELEWLYKVVNFCSDIPRHEAAELHNFLKAVKSIKTLEAKWWNEVRRLPIDGFETLCKVGQTPDSSSTPRDKIFKTFLNQLWKIGLVDKKSKILVPKNKAERLLKFLIFCSSSKIDLIDLAREELVNLQNGGAENISIWREMIHLSQIQFDTIYDQLGVKFNFALGESFYNPWLGEVVVELLTRGIARESEGAVGVFSDGSLPPKDDPFLVSRDDEWVSDPALVRKSDGGFNYMTTDLATIDFRLKVWSPDEIVYVVDDRQSGHFKKLFFTFARWKPNSFKKTKLVHVGFGKIMGDDGKPFKTRSGDTVKLGELLNESVDRAFKNVSEKNPEIPQFQRKEIARIVGIGAVKYADLLPNRQSDYIFNWDKMLASQGNTAPYLQYAYARIRSIFRKAGKNRIQNLESKIQVEAPEEIALAKYLLNFGLTLEAAAEEFRPNYLCNYLFELAVHFSRFFENCPVLKAEDEATRQSRLALCDLTARVLKQGLATLGIETVEQM